MNSRNSKSTNAKNICKYTAYRILLQQLWWGPGALLGAPHELIINVWLTHIVFMSSLPLLVKISCDYHRAAKLCTLWLWVVEVLIREKNVNVAYSQGHQH